MPSSSGNSSPPGQKDLTGILHSNLALLHKILAHVDAMLAHSTGEEDAILSSTLRQHEQFPALSGLKRLRSMCTSELAYHERLSLGEIPLDPYVKSTNAAHMSALFRFLKLSNPEEMKPSADDSRVLAGILQAIHFKQTGEAPAQQRPSWSDEEGQNLPISHRNGTLADEENDECAYASDGEEESFEINTFGAVENLLIENETENERPPLVVDIQAFSGHVWLKAIARNPRSLLRAAKGECEFGEKSILSYAGDYTEASQLRPIHHRNPFLIFFFEFGLTTGNDSSTELLGESPIPTYPIVAEQLLGAGVLPAVSIEKYQGISLDNFPILREAARRVNICSFCRLTLDDVFEQLLHQAGAVPLLPAEAVSQDLDSTIEWLRSRFGEAVVAPPSIGPEMDPLRSVDIKNGVNVDVSTLLVLVSNLTNGRCDDSLFASNRHRALREQAANERKRPVLVDQLGPFFAKRPNIILYCSETALKSFDDIVRILAGPAEKARADALRERLQILPDVVSQRVAALPESVNVKPRAKVIFGFGDAYRLVTLTANAAFIRAALFHAGGVLGHQLAIYLHPSRALSEQKEEIGTAEPIPVLSTPSSPQKWIQQLLAGEVGSSKR